MRAGTQGSLYFPNVESTRAQVGVDIGHLGLQGESFTISVWVRVAAGAMTAWSSQSSNFLAILGIDSIGGNCGERDCLHIRFEDGAVLFGFYYDDLRAAVDTAFSASSEEEQWHHWSFTFNAENLQRCVIRDGGIVQCDTAGGSLAANYGMRIGGQFTNAPFPFMGHMANFAVWREALSSVILGAYSTCQWETMLTPQANLVFFSAIASDMNFVAGESFDTSQVISTCAGTRLGD